MKPQNERGLVLDFEPDLILELEIDLELDLGLDLWLDALVSALRTGGGGGE
jgi:hypothetical protein